MSGGEFAEIEARAVAVADAFHDDVPLELDTYVWKYAPGHQKRFTSIWGEQGEIAAIEGWDDDATATIEALIGAVNIAREDIPRLLAAVRERDNTIARVRAVHERNYGFPTINGVRLAGARPVVYCEHCQVDYPCDTIAALDPEETL